VLRRLFASLFRWNAADGPGRTIKRTADAPSFEVTLANGRGRTDQDALQSCPASPLADGCTRGKYFCCSNVEFSFSGPPRRVRFGKCFSHFPRHRLVFHPHREYRRFKHVERFLLGCAMIDLNGTRGGSYHRSLFHSHQGRAECMMMTYRWTCIRWNAAPLLT
jgi:hypothetical protein